jgi:hypothetical protein
MEKEKEKEARKVVFTKESLPKGVLFKVVRPMIELSSQSSRPTLSLRLLFLFLVVRYSC